MPFHWSGWVAMTGDELPHPTQEQVVATGFLRNSMLNEEGGVDPEQFRMQRSLVENKG